MNKAGKVELAQDRRQKLSKAQVALFADYKGLSATQADDLRKVVRATKGEVRVIKNNIARIVVQDGSFGEDAKQLFDGVVGPTLVAFAYGDIAATAKVFHKFSQDNEAFTLKDSLMGRKKISSAQVEELAKLPSREVLLAKVLGTLNAPASNFVGVLAAVPRSLLNVLVAIEGKKKDAA